MNTPESSRVDWNEKLGEADVDLDWAWQSESSLKESPIGDSDEEKIFDHIFGGRRNEHEPLRIVPVRNAAKLTDSDLQELIRQKKHMFMSRIWNVVTEHFEETHSLSGIKLHEVTEKIRGEIQALAVLDEKSNKIYESILDEAAMTTFTVLGSTTAEAVIESLDDASRAAALHEAKEAYERGDLAVLSYTDVRTSKEDDPAEEDLLLAYSEKMIDQLLGNFS